MDASSLCHDCGLIFTEKYMLKEHKRVAHDDNSEILINEFKCKFEKLYTDFKLPMTLKIHVIVDHYSDYFKETGNFFRKTNGEHHEAIHHTIKVFETKQKTFI